MNFRAGQTNGDSVQLTTMSSMARTFRTLAVLLTLAILVTISIGFWSFLTPGEAKFKDIFIVHFVCGLSTAIGILLVHCLIFTYFLGTGRGVNAVAAIWAKLCASTPSITSGSRSANWSSRDTARG